MLSIATELVEETQKIHPRVKKRTVPGDTIREGKTAHQHFVLMNPQEPLQKNQMVIEVIGGIGVVVGFINWVHVEEIFCKIRKKFSKTISSGTAGAENVRVKVKVRCGAKITETKKRGVSHSV